MAESSTVARWELALRIKARRAQLKIKADEIAQKLEFTRNFFSAVENERAMLAIDKLELLMELLDFSESERAEMRGLNQIARRRGWWESNEELLGVEAARYLGLEQGAKEIRIFESLAIAGLLQTREYMEAVFHRDPAMGRLAMREVIEIRLQRQSSVLASRIPVKLLVSEAALVQVWSTAAMQSAQLRKIVELTKETDLEVRVLPFDRPPGPIATSSTLNILDFESEHLPSLIWQEPLRSVDFVGENDEDYSRIRIAWEDGFTNALPPDESEDRILAVASQLDQE